MIPISKPFFDPEREYVKMISKITQAESLIDADSLVKSLENKLEKCLKVSNVSFVINRSHALKLAIKSLNLKGEIITAPFMPFSNIELSNHNIFGNCSLVFADVKKSTLNIDTKNIEALITTKTTAIFATHVYGNPCDVIEIDRIAKKYNLKVIYDATHAFNVLVNGISIFGYGDVSICSTRTTKLFDTVEGALVVCNNNSTFLKLKEIKNTISSNSSFPTTSVLNSDFYASMGILNLKYIHQISEKRKKLTNIYDKYLKNIDVVKPIWHKDSLNNYSCYTLIFPNESILLKCLESLKSYDISALKSFYISYENLKTTSDLGKRVLCLPLYFDLNEDEVSLICAIIQYEFLLFERALA